MHLAQSLNHRLCVEEVELHLRASVRRQKHLQVLRRFRRLALPDLALHVLALQGQLLQGHVDALTAILRSEGEGFTALDYAELI